MKHILLGSLLLLARHGFTQARVVNDTIAFAMNGQNNMYVKAVFNRTDTLNLISIPVPPNWC